MNEHNVAERIKNTGRNDQCPCGSGKKYKKCHLSEDLLFQQKEIQQQRDLDSGDDVEKGSAVQEESRVTHFKDEARHKFKPSKITGRSNAPRRQAGK